MIAWRDHPDVAPGADETDETGVAAGAGPDRSMTPELHDGVLDNRRVPCALGLVRLRQAMADMAPGEVVVVLSRDRFAPFEIPLWAERAGHDLLDVTREGVWPRRQHRITLRKAGQGIEDAVGEDVVDQAAVGEGVVGQAVVAEAAVGEGVVDQAAVGQAAVGEPGGGRLP